jgi:hypothetical protein
VGKLRERIRDALPWLDPVLEVFHWREYVVLVVVGIGGAAWTWLQHLPSSIVVIGSTCAVLAVANARMLVAVWRLRPRAAPLARPNVEIWRHPSEYTLFQAACLLADVEPDAGLPAPNAKAWFAALKSGVERGDLQPKHSPGELRAIRAGLTIDYGKHTKIGREQLEAFIRKIDPGKRPPFLFS